MVVMSEVVVAVESSRSTPAVREAGTRITRPSISPHSAPAISWVSSLGQQDLAMLLSVLEQQVLPQMIAGYSPAKQSSLDALPHPKR